MELSVEFDKEKSQRLIASLEMELAYLKQEKNPIPGEIEFYENELAEVYFEASKVKFDDF